MNKILFSLSFLLPLLLRGGWKESAIAALLLALAVALWQEDRAGLLRHLRSPMRLALIALGLLLALSALWTPGNALLALCLGVGFLWLALWSAMAEDQPVSLLLGLLLGAAALQATLGILGVLLETRPFADQTGGRWVAAGTVQYPLALVGILAAAMPFALRGCFAQDAWQRWLGISLLPLFALALMLSGQRLAWLALALALVALVIWPAAFAARRLHALWLFAGTLPLALLSLALMHPSFNAQASSGILHGREEGWREALDLAAKKPWGWGEGAWDIVSGQKSLFVHSLPLEALVGAGVLAAGASLLFFFFWLQRGIVSLPLLLMPLLIGSILFLFDWAWLLPAVSGSFLLSTILAGKKENTYNPGDA